MSSPVASCSSLSWSSTPRSPCPTARGSPTPWPASRVSASSGSACFDRARMLLAIDVGNTQTHLGTRREADLVEHWRFATVRDSTADGLALQLVGAVALRGLGLDDVDGAVVFSVLAGHSHGCADL